MSSKLPPVPAENRSDKGPGDATGPDTQDAANPPSNPDKTGQAGNSKVNTTHQGYQQNR